MRRRRAPFIPSERWTIPGSRTSKSQPDGSASSHVDVPVAVQGSAAVNLTRSWRATEPTASVSLTRNRSRMMRHDDERGSRRTIKYQNVSLCRLVARI